MLVFYCRYGFWVFCCADLGTFFSYFRRSGRPNQLAKGAFFGGGCANVFEHGGLLYFAQEAEEGGGAVMSSVETADALMRVTEFVFGAPVSVIGFVLLVGGGSKYRGWGGLS